MAAEGRMPLLTNLKDRTRNVLFAFKLIGGGACRARGEAAESNHPERRAVLPYCLSGKGIDVGCGNRKTTENCIGIDLVAKGCLGSVGCVRGKASQADICASGDDLYMFKDGELDFVVARHNLEHYVDVVKTIKEWRRVLKTGGVMAVILPDEDGLNRVNLRGVALDVTHHHSFSMTSFRNLVTAIGGFEIVKIEPVVENWSFIGVCRAV